MVDKRDPATRTEGETLDLPEGMQGFAKGQILGERYQIVELLGRGGMGEVWHAFDLKLRVEVALKALRPEFFKSERRLELLRQEVRAAREVMSPNVCRIFDLIEIEGRELVSMEYVDGATLLGVLQERGPLELKEAQDIASQFLAGLEAIHKVGLIHRDIKPENIMLTRAGRVVVMDFGLARQETEGGGTVAGTPAYMSPEQAAGQTVDARADVYAAGVVLAEMVSPEGIKSFESRQSIWEGVRSEPAKVPDSPWAQVIKKAVAKDREGRFNSAHTLTRALEDVTLRVEGAENLHPYPGLASFSEEDAEYFFGREAEVEQMWRKLEGPPRLFAIMGPSGTGKSSFIAAGLVPNALPDWGIIRSTPGNAAISSLAAVVARETAGDPDAVELLPRFDDPEVAIQVLAHWGGKNTHSLLIVDQFEELFTQNSDDEQHRFSDLLNRVVLEGDIHVLLSMRDDFAAACNAHESLRPIFHEMTVLDPPAGANLRRAVVHPAQKCGYRFEDDELVEEMLAEVEGERGALPLLAFAAAQLWERRDRETGLLTREAYQGIGGVGGALAQHAEATIDRIGSERIGIVRELFRNLVTAEGTRAVREWNELLSVFDAADVSRAGIKPAPTKDHPPPGTTIVGAGFIPSRNAAEEVLHELIDARLLTSYEIKEEDREPTRRIEIIHESLLANWPRLVRWQIQDQEGVQLREELRQASKTWDDHSRSDDLLWTGTAYREFVVWRERYSGGLSQVEEAFTAAMSSFATRKRRRRRAAATATLVMTVAVATVFATLWRRSVRETRRAEAAKLLALAQVQLDTDPTEALVYTTASLELADNETTRSFVLSALGEGPPATILKVSDCFPRFSPDGGRIAVAGSRHTANIWTEAGDGPIVLNGLETSPLTWNVPQWSSEELIVTGMQKGERVQLWSIPGGRLVRKIEFGAPTYWWVRDDRLFSETIPTEPTPNGDTFLRSWPLADGEPEDLGWVDWDALGGSWSIFEPSGKSWFYFKDRTLFARPLPVKKGVGDRIVGTLDSRDVTPVWSASHGDRMVSINGEGELRVWSLPAPSEGLIRVISRPEGAPQPYSFSPDPTGQWVYYENAAGIGKGLLWDLAAPPAAQPLELRRSGAWELSHFAFHPRGEWLAATTQACTEVSFWPLRKVYPSVVKGNSGLRKGLAFSPDGRWLASSWPPFPGWVRLFPLPNTAGTDVPDLGELSVLSNIVFDRSGTRLTGGHYGHQLSVGFLDRGESRRLEGFQSETMIEDLAFSPSGRLVAGASGIGYEEKVLRVWNLDTGEVRTFDLPRTDTSSITGLAGYLDNVQNLWFTDEDTLVTVGATQFLRWNLRDGSNEEILDLGPVVFRTAAASDDVRKVLIIELPDDREGDICDTPTLYDLAAGTAKLLPSFGDCARVIALDPSGTVAVTGDADGLIRVGHIDGQPHLLAGHEGAIECVAISPDLQWVASMGTDGTLRLWPMPDFSKPPLHTLPHDELIAKLHSLTNLRAIRDDESATGWKVEVGPFPGWAEVPEW